MSFKIKSPIYIGIVVGIILCLIAFTLFVLYTEYSNGIQIRPYDTTEEYTDYMKSLRTDYDNLLSHYADQVKLVSSAFAFLAFLITYQNKNNIKVTPRGWGFLVAGVIVLVLSLILSQFGKELLYTMSIRNSIDISLPGLTISRLINYFCLIIAACCIGFYALELTNAITKPIQNNTTYEMD